ncbi:MAG: ParB/RepB/Spo0J family partition protein [Bacillota bacterium]|nr:ParB/RepB/Spo0J family partition protein [Bacillota bacterium]
MPANRPALGRGLQALFPEGLERKPGEEVRLLPVAAIRANPMQPRRRIDDAKLQELVSSIREHGVLEPVIVRRVGERYELVAGERRWRAASEAGLKEIPAILRDVEDRQMLELALIENIQREELSPLDEARAYATLIHELGLTQEEVARRVGKSRSTIANALRLLQLPERVAEWVETGALSEGHARALLAVGDEGERERLAREAVEQGWSVREVERRARARAARRGGTREAVRPRVESAPGGGAGEAEAAEPEAAEPEASADWTPELARMEERLQDALGSPVRIRAGRNGGTVEIRFFGMEDLERLFEALAGAGRGGG